MAKVMKSPVQASLHVFSKTFCPKLDFFYCIYRFLSAGDCHHGNRLVSVVFKLCKRIISPIDMTSFCKNHTRQNPRILQCILTSAWKCLSLISRFFYSHTYPYFHFNNNHWSITIYSRRWQEAKAKIYSFTTWEIMVAWRLFTNLCSTILL